MKWWDKQISIYRRSCRTIGGRPVGGGRLAASRMTAGQLAAACWRRPVGRVKGGKERKERNKHKIHININQWSFISLSIVLSPLLFLIPYNKTQNAHTQIWTTHNSMSLYMNDILIRVFPSHFYLPKLPKNWKFQILNGNWNPHKTIKRINSLRVFFFFIISHYKPRRQLVRRQSASRQEGCTVYRALK